jgi:conjugal transfer pilus assembly protein TraV
MSRARAAQRPDLRPRLIAASIALLASGALVSCATFGGHMRGNFQCRVPGGHCAPTSEIDDQALAAMSDETASNVPVTPNQAMRNAQSRHSLHAMRIVLLPRQDRFGRWHDQTIIYAEIDEQSDPVLLTTSGVNGRQQQLALADLAAGAPELIVEHDIAVSPDEARNMKPVTPAEIEAAVRAQLSRSGALSRPRPVGAAPVPPSPVMPPTPAAVTAPPFPASKGNE